MLAAVHSLSPSDITGEHMDIVLGILVAATFLVLVGIASNDRGFLAKIALPLAIILGLAVWAGVRFEAKTAREEGESAGVEKGMTAGKEEGLHTTRSKSDLKSGSMYRVLACAAPESPLVILAGPDGKFAMYGDLKCGSGWNQLVLGKVYTADEAGTLHAVP